MASNTRMEESPLQWRRAQEAAQDAMEMKSSRVGLHQSATAELGLLSYPETSKLSYGMENECPWRSSKRCLETGQELAGGQLSWPYPPSSPCLQGTLCHPKDGAELPLLPPNRNGQPKVGCKERLGLQWTETMLTPLALYSHRYHHYLLPFPGPEGQCPDTASKPCVTAGDGASDPPALRHCPYLVEAKHNPFFLSSLVPTRPLADVPFGGGAPEGPGTMDDRHLTGADWRLGFYMPAWDQPLYLGVPPRCKAAPASFDDSSSSGNKEFYPKKTSSFQHPAKDQEPLQLLGKDQMIQDGDGVGKMVMLELPGTLWRDGRAGGSLTMPTPHACTPSPSASHLLQPGMVGDCPWVGTWPHNAKLLPELGPGWPFELRDEHQAYQSFQPSLSSGLEGTDPLPPLTDRHYPLPLAKPELPPVCLCNALGCDGCLGVGCGVLSPFEPALSIPGSRFPCPPSNHTKLKKTWLTRHSEQSLPHCKAPQRDSGPEPASEGKRLAKRLHGAADGPHNAGEVARAAKRGRRAIECVATACLADGTESRRAPEETRMEFGEEESLNHPNLLAQEPWCLQTVPCTALPESIPRCCACAARALGDSKGEEEEDPPESTCRLLYFRRFAFGDSGKPSVDGFCTLGEAEGEIMHLGAAASPKRGNKNSGSSLCLAKYLLRVLGDSFCEAVCRDRDVWLAETKGVMAWRRGEGGPRVCDACQHGFFNSHWSCARCGFQLCPNCHHSKQEADGQEGLTQLSECTPGQEHHSTSLVPTQFVPSHILTRVWKLLHQVRAEFGIKSHCLCGQEPALQSPMDAPGTRQEPSGAGVPTFPPSRDGQANTIQPIKEAESPKGGTPPLGQPPLQGAMQTATLCDLLASTAVKLCLGRDGVCMAFAPVSPSLPSDNHLTSILDSIIAHVVERKIQERQVGGELSIPSPSTSHSTLTPSGLLWLRDSSNTSSYKLFQEHWRQGQPVLVSGLQKRLEGRLWGPESFCPAGGEQAVEVVNLRAPSSRIRMSSQEFWDGFAAGTASLEPERGGRDLLKLESGFGDMELCRTANLNASLPLPEYCGPTGRLNLATYLQGQWARRWLRPRVCVAYGVHPQDQTIGTKNLTVEAADSISVLVHAVPAARQDLLLQADADSMEMPMKERLWDTGSRPGALWHIFRAEDAGRIQDFLQKACKDQGQEGVARAEYPSCYLDLSLRRRLRQESGVTGWTLLQFLGDAVLVPAGAPHQVQTLTSTISVEQRFLSPENAARLWDHGTDYPGAARQLRAQLDGVIFSAVQEAVGALRGCEAPVAGQEDA
ncbi:lysine-specific demethylase hairless [Colius striatus]|uniref:lysine-specific demethylase hairless n=1 Tax=Colius striatus TaxID=57412 RepID=UPI002B1D50FB|nr:lysine-specific demethylase hairless [Colius striatus]